MPQGKSDKDLLAELLAKGYGAEDRRQRRARGLSRVVRPSGSGAQRQREERPPLERRTAAARGKIAAEEEAEEVRRRMEDSLPKLAPAVRRQIDRYAWRNRYKATGLWERLRSLATLVVPGIEDYASGELLRMLVGAADPADPANCNVLDGLQSLAASARALLGRDRGVSGAAYRPDDAKIPERIAASIRAQEPFLEPLLSFLGQSDPAAIRALQFARMSYRRGEPVRVRSLVRPVRAIYRIALATESLDDDLLARLMDKIVEIGRAHEVDAAGRRRVQSSAVAVRVLLGRLREVRHELFPVLLKCMAVFFPEQSLWEAENLARVRTFCGLKEEELLDYHRVRDARKAAVSPLRHGSGEAQGDTEARAVEAVSTAASETAPGEEASVRADAESVWTGAGAPVPSFSERFQRALASLRELFPDSGIHRLAQYHFILPYFDLRVFSKDLSFPPAAQLVARNDPMGHVMVLHRIIDNLISSVDWYLLGHILGVDTERRDATGDLLRQWKDVYASLFDRYLRGLEDYSRIVETDRLSPTARRIEDTLNRIRNYVIRHFGRIIPGVGRLDISAEPLYSLAKRLALECRGVLAKVSSRLVAERNPQAMALAEMLAEKNVVDLEAEEYKPVMVRVRRLLERRLAMPVARAGVKAQLAFLELLADVAELYAWLLNDEASFYRNPPDGPVFAGLEERRRWASAREAAMMQTVASSPRALRAVASAGRWVEEVAGRFETLRRSGRLALALMEMQGREVLEAEGDTQAEIAAAVLAPGAEHPVELIALGRERLLALTLRGARATAALADRWRVRVAESLGRHSLFGEILEQQNVPGLGTLVVAVAEVGDCAGPREALARVENVLEAARGGLGPVAVWHEGRALSYADFLSRVGR